MSTLEKSMSEMSIGAEIQAEMEKERLNQESKKYNTELIKNLYRPIVEFILLKKEKKQ